MRAKPTNPTPRQAALMRRMCEERDLMFRYLLGENVLCALWFWAWESNNG